MDTIRADAMLRVFSVTPVAKPRMTRQDKWPNPPKKHKGPWPRPSVAAYRAFQDELRIKAQGFEMPASGYHVVFVLPMPKTWSLKKKKEMYGTPHRQKPDKDNLEKALLDTLCPGDDAHVWDGRVSKIWGKEGGIVITECPPFALTRVHPLTLVPLG